MDFTGVYNPNNFMSPYPQIQFPAYRPQSTTPVNNQNADQIIKVNGIESARAYPTQPNSMIALFDANDDIFYVKTTDASNYPTIRRFRFVEESEEAARDEKYVTVEEFNKFKEEMLNGQQFIRTSSNPHAGAKSNAGYRGKKPSGAVPSDVSNGAE